MLYPVLGVFVGAGSPLKDSGSSGQSVRGRLGYVWAGVQLCWENSTQDMGGVGQPTVLSWKWDMLAQTESHQMGQQLLQWSRNFGRVCMPSAIWPSLDPGSISSQASLPAEQQDPLLPDTHMLLSHSVGTPAPAKAPCSQDTLWTFQFSINPLCCNYVLTGLPPPMHPCCQAPLFSIWVCPATSSNPSLKIFSRTFAFAPCFSPPDIPSILSTLYIGT